MPRVKRGPKARKRRKKTLALAKGFYGRSKNTIRQATSAVENALAYAYVGRKLRKRDFRSLWTQRINAAARINGTTYSKLINSLSTKNIKLDRKVLADIAVSQPKDFKSVVEFSQQ